jgi:sec-independent protein translocase protein TatB
MFELDWAKLVVIGVVALIAIGPKELPTVLRTVGQWMTKIRRMAAEFQGQFQEAMREAEMAELKKQVDEISSAAKDATTFDPLQSTPAAAASPSAPSTAPPSVTTDSAAFGQSGQAEAAPQPEPAASSSAQADLAVPLPEPPPPVTEKDFAASSEAQPAPAQPEARDHPP